MSVCVMRALITVMFSRLTTGLPVMMGYTVQKLIHANKVFAKVQIIHVLKINFVVRKVIPVFT